MRIIAHGIDLVDCKRLARSIERHGRKFLDRVFTPVEQEYSRDKKSEIQHLAGRFAIKEAVLKVLGTGWANGIAWTDIEVRNAPSGQPRVFLSGKCREVAERLGIVEIHISISHIDTHAIGSAVGVGTDDAAGAAEPEE